MTKLTNVFTSSCHLHCIACNAPLEVLWTRAFGNVLCQEKVEKQKLSVLFPSGCKCQSLGQSLTLSGVAPIGRHNTGVRCLLRRSNEQQQLLEPLAGIYVFQAPSEGRNPANNNGW